MNLGDLIRTSARRCPDKLALVDIDKKVRFTYKEFNGRINALAHGLLKAGIREGDKVAILFYNSHLCAESFFALAKIGAIACLINFRLAPEELVTVLSRCDANWLIFEEAFKGSIDKIRSELPKLERFILDGKDTPEDMINYEALIKKNPSTEVDKGISGSSTASFPMTGGTTGIPKICDWNHDAPLLLAAGSSIDLSLTLNDINIMMAPMFHLSGFGLTFLAAIMVNATNVIMRSFNPEKVLEIVEKEKVTLGFFIPAMASIIVYLPEETLNKYDTSSLRFWISGGAQFPTDLKKQVCEKFPNVKLHEYYGAHEIGMIASAKHEDLIRKEVTVGKPWFYSEVKIVDNDGNELSPNKVGEIWVRTPNEIRFYKNPQKNREEYTEDGWWASGDIGKFDEEGFLFIVDRKKDMIISGGENIYSSEIETVLSLHPKVQEGVIIGIPDEKWGEAVKAIVVLKKGEEATEEGIIDFCKEKLAGYKCPKSLDFVEALIKNPMGKVLKREMRKWYTEKR